jgi:hypothetical protein
MSPVEIFCISSPSVPEGSPKQSAFCFCLDLPNNTDGRLRAEFKTVTGVDQNHVILAWRTMPMKCA